MARRILRIAVVALVVLAVGAAVLVATSRPRLQDARTAVDRAWPDLVTELDDRYEALATFAAAVEQVGGRGAATAADVDAALEQWDRDRARATTGPVAANSVEARAALLFATVTDSPRLAQDPTVTTTGTVFAAAVPDADVLERYNAAVTRYQALRTDPWRGPVARLFGYSGRTTVQIAEPPPAGEVAG